MSDIQAVNNSSSDEIDLVELVKTLWQGKVTIAVCTVVFTVCAIVYAFTAQQWWTSDAIVTKGQYKDTDNIRSQVTNLYSVIDVSKVNNIFESDRLLKEYITEFNAFDNKKAFIEQNAIMKQYAKEADVNKDGQGQFIVSWAKKINASQVDEKKRPNVYELSFEATSAELAHDLLEAYSSFISNQVRNEAFSVIESKIANNKQLLSAEKTSLELKAKEEQKALLSKTDYALDIARSAKVIKPLADVNVTGVFPIQLGTEGLKEQSNILQSMKDLSFFEPRLTQIQIKLDLLSKIHLDKDVAMQSVRYLKNIDYPISRDKPKRPLIAVLGFLLGIMLGVAIVLLKSAFNKSSK
ncbi:LPS O-antigen chain length determinant protein WzzB [Photobacterium leiognathi]|uniref:LPS O-antigen chain length determinant protein WzzB n=1 Tax=Photobacterium leiognathi TaxID=553611 RepID=UPI002981FC9A|nr:Wzz/FepE/Etk N-terminal domain-containing protein [Photobacterium leiognathi]